MKKVKIKVEFEYKVPDEANWLTVDADGTTCWFEDKPENRKGKGFDRWIPTRAESSGGLLEVGLVADWENSLIKV